MSEKPTVTLPIIVEGRYDKSTLQSIVSANVLTTEGFGIFNNKEKQALLRRIGERGIIVMVDSDGGGRQIRSFLLSILPREKIHNLHIPKIEGKEKRKRGKDGSGYLGVEGMSPEVILRLLAPFIGEKNQEKKSKKLTKVDLFADKLTGYPNSAERRARLSAMLDLPTDMTPNALLEALNLLCTEEEYRRAVSLIEIEREKR